MAVKSKSPDNLVDQFVKKAIKKPHVFFAEDSSVSDQALAVAKHFYDTAKEHEQEKISSLDELLIDGFDIDQIWEEITMQNKPFLNVAKRSLKQLGRMKEREPESLEYDEEDDLGEDFDYQDEDMEEGNEDEDLEDGDLGLEEDEGEDSEDLEANVEEEEESQTSGDERPNNRSEVDDDFFNLEQFNKWTEEQEEKDMRSDDEDDEDADDGVDFTRDMNEEDDDEDDDMTEINYNDFFAAPKRQARAPKDRKRVTFDEQEEEEEEEEGNGESLSGDEDKKVSNLFDDDKEQVDKRSAYEKQTERVQALIDQFEEENISDKHWTLRGETTAKARPVNSLLEEDMEFDHSSKPVPVITQESTNVLEDLIKKRINDNIFDDVQRKEDPTFRPFLPSKRVELNDEKSKKSLTELYEDDFVKQSTGDTSNAKDEALKIEHEKITALFTQLSTKLDSLSNFHYTPKPAKPELTVVSNAAAISMEEVMPVNVSDATLLAPEEVYDKKRGEVKSTSEMSQEERKRARALKKKMKRKDEALKERERKVIEKMRPGLGHKQAKVKAVKELLGQKNVTIIGQEKNAKKKPTAKAVTAASLF